MRPLKRSTMPLVLGVLGLVNRFSMPSAWHSRSNSWLPLGSRSRLANSRSVNSLPLSVRSLLILIGQALCRALRNARALAACTDRVDHLNHLLAINAPTETVWSESRLRLRAALG